MYLYVRKLPTETPCLLRIVKTIGLQKSSNASVECSRLNLLLPCCYSLTSHFNILNFNGSQIHLFTVSWILHTNLSCKLLLVFFILPALFPSQQILSVFHSLVCSVFSVLLSDYIDFLLYISGNYCLVLSFKVVPPCIATYCTYYCLLFPVRFYS